MLQYTCSLNKNKIKGVVLIGYKILSWSRLVRVLVVMLLLGVILTEPKTNTIVTSSDKISNETLDNVIYADTEILGEIEAAVEFATLTTDDVVKKEEVTYVAIKTTEDTLSNEREKEGKKLAKKIRESQARLTFDPFNKSNLTEEQFNKILEGTVMKGQGSSFSKVEEEYGVNGLFAIAVAFHESGYGKHQANKNNLYGMRGSKGWMSFDSMNENILYFGKLMNKERYFGKSIEQIGKVYCPPTPTSWAKSVKKMMTEIYKKI